MTTYFPKFMELDELSPNGEPSIQIVRLHEFNKLAHVKTSSEALDYIRDVKPIPGKTVILVLAMTAGEHYGPNRNGDAWNEKPLKVGKSVITEDDVLPKHYKTFETNANVFQHHVNKDPEKKIGDVLKAFYNWPMHRVELLLALDNKKAESAVQQIEEGKFPAVSMGCFTAGNEVTLADGSRKAIEEIQIGDMVLTHHGKARPVTKLYQRNYTGNLYTIKAAGNPDITCTEEHPFLAEESPKLRNFKWGKAAGWNIDVYPDPKWIHAKCLENHLVFSPIISETTPTVPYTKEFARLLGAYLADGHTTHNHQKEINGIELNVSEKNPIIEEIFGIAESLKLPNTPIITTPPHSEHCIKIGLYGKDLASVVQQLAGKYAKEKRLDQSVMRWPTELQRQLIGSYANGDGCFTGKGALQLSTASKYLAWQIQSILYRLEIVPSVQCVVHKPGGGFNFHDTTEYTISIGKQQVQKLADVCYKIKPMEIGAVRTDRKIYGDLCATPIRETTIEYVTDVPVYNFEVQDDESYVVNGIAVHNCKVKNDICSVCGNAAPSRAQYCDHAKYNLGDMLSNGKRIFVWNPSPKFFDISIVRRPADRLGFMMKKVAEAVPEIRSGAELGEYIDQASKKVAALRKLSIIHKILSGQIGAIKDDSGEVKELKQLSDQIAKPAAAAMPEIDDSTIRSLIQYRPAQVLSTLAEMGITLTTPEFLKYFAWQVDPSMPISEDAIERAIASQQKVFGMLAEHPELLDEIEETGYLDMSPKNFNPQIAEKLQPLVEKRSQHRDWIVKRGYIEQSGFRPREFGEYHPGDYTTVTMQDPNTGKVYQTTQSAINRAHGMAQKQRWGNILGGGALLAGGMAMLPFRGARMLSPLLFGPGAYQMFKGVKGQPHVMSDAGPIYQRVQPQNSPLSTFYQPGFEGTELVEKQSSFEHLDVPNAMIRLAMDMQHHPGSKNRRVAPISVETDHASFDEVAEKIGAAIYL